MRKGSCSPPTRRSPTDAGLRRTASADDPGPVRGPVQRTAAPSEPSALPASARSRCCGPLPEAPGQISRRGCLFALLALVITATMLTWAALFALHRIFPAPPAVWSAGGEQFAQLSSLQGTRQDSAGGKMIFTGSRFTAAASGGIIAGGTVTFVDVPQAFSWAAGPPPPSYGHGTIRAHSGKSPEGTATRLLMTPPSCSTNGAPQKEGLPPRTANPAARS
jgi:hypothetical protein